MAYHPSSAAEAPVPHAGGLSPALRQELRLVAAWIEDHRQRSYQPREPWPDEPMPPWGGSSFAQLVHLNNSMSNQASTVDLGADALSQAEALGLIRPTQGGHLPGRWQLTAYRGVFGVRDRPSAGHGSVFLGDDGIRLLGTVLDAEPAGTVLDVGCGAGLATAGAARSATHVYGFDVVPACVAAARTSARLNAVASKVTITRNDIRHFQPLEPVDCIVANLPGVPVPPGLAYIPAGNGGHDGLALTHRLLGRVSVWTKPHGAQRSDAPVLIMRLQSPGDPYGPFALADLERLASTVRFDITVVTDSRIDVHVRDSLTVKYATQANPRVSKSDIEHAVRSHSRSLGMTHYYSSSVVAYPGTGQLHHVDLAISDVLHRNGTAGLPVSEADLHRTVGRYFARLARLPVGFWELGHRRHVEGPPARIRNLLALVREGHTAAEAVRQVFADEFAPDPVGALAMYSTAVLLLEAAQEVVQQRPLRARAETSA